MSGVVMRCGYGRGRECRALGRAWAESNGNETMDEWDQSPCFGETKPIVNRKGRESRIESRRLSNRAVRVVVGEGSSSWPKVCDAECLMLGWGAPSRMRECRDAMITSGVGWGM